jgi:hypothetical protein
MKQAGPIMGWWDAWCSTGAGNPNKAENKPSITLSYYCCQLGWLDLGRPSNKKTLMHLQSMLEVSLAAEHFVHATAYSIRPLTSCALEKQLRTTKPSSHTMQSEPCSIQF